MLNRFSPCLNYHCPEELETATADRIQEQEEALSKDHRKKNFATGVAFDNVDVLTQTHSGTDTLHDTMDFLYHNVPIETEEKLE